MFLNHKGEQQGDTAAQHKAGRSVAVRKGGNEVHALKEAAGVDHAKDAGCDQYQHRGDQVRHMTAGVGAVVHIVAVFLHGCKEFVARTFDPFTRCGSFGTSWDFPVPLPKLRISGNYCLPCRKTFVSFS